MPIKNIDTYIKDILNEYEKRGVLLDPTRTDIKEACLARLSGQMNVRDKVIVQSFFNATDEDDLYKIIDYTEPEKFRTIQYFLTKKSSSTGKRNLNLIAWLIDFNPRPYNLYRKPNVGGGDSGIDIEIETEPKKEKEDEGDKIIPILISNGEPGKNSKEEDTVTTKVAISKPEKIPEKGKEIEVESENEPEKDSKSKKWILTIISLIAVSLMLFYGTNYFLDSGKMNSETKPLEETNPINTTKKCMAWAETKYILADCTNSIHPEFATKVKAYDESLFKDLKKVNVTIKTPFFEPNTKTPLIWYYKIAKGKFEYYKSYGLHPIYDQPLDPITQGHIDTYIPKYKNDEKSFLKE